MEIENSKRIRETAKEVKVKKAKEKKVIQEAEKKVEVIRQRKKEEKKKVEIQQQKEANKPKALLKVGDRVRLEDGKAVGTIDIIEKGKATVNYGIFTTSVSLDQLELVQAAKKKK